MLEVHGGDNDTLMCDDEEMFVVDAASVLQYAERFLGS